ncbi:hypothetical protein OAF73_00785 [Planctomycetota bacterium]|nr:hypothetical protein [Planctomycetota bacterium]
MKNQLPLLLLLSASTFGLGHELGANGPRDNPDTPWAPGDEPRFTQWVSNEDYWKTQNSGFSDRDFFRALDDRSCDLTDLTIAEEVGGWVRMPKYGPQLGEGRVVWWKFDAVMDAERRRAPSDIIRIPVVTLPAK